MNKDIRWKQRFQNYEKSVKFLEEAVKINQPDIFQKAGTIQFFEVSFELAWNVMKDYLDEQGFTELRSPRDTLKKAFEVGLVEDGHAWLQTLQDRNLTSHTYDEQIADKVVDSITHIYLPLLQKLLFVLKEKL